MFQPLKYTIHYRKYSQNMETEIISNFHRYPNKTKRIYCVERLKTTRVRLFIIMDLSFRISEILWGIFQRTNRIRGYLPLLQQYSDVQDEEIKSSFGIIAAGFELEVEFQQLPIDGAKLF